jgi:threonine/homoserine/homoserine lactone efflux protein
LDPSSLLIFAGALLVASGSPGPSIAALVARVIARGHRDVLPFLIAMWVGEAIWLTFAVFGLSALAETFHAAFVLLKWAGVAYLLFLAWRMWGAPVTLDSDAIPDRAPPLRMFAAGLAVTLGNPKIMMFYLALLPSIIDVGQIDLAGWLELTATMLAVLIAVDLAWVGLASTARRFLRKPSSVRIANRMSAGMMAGAAAAIASK